MDFTRVSRRSAKIHFEGLQKYPHELQLYHDFPAFTISIGELEQSMAERLCVLQTLEEVGNRGLKVGTEDWRKAVIEDLKKHNLRGFCKLLTATSLGSDVDDFNMRRRDHMSHYMLRVSYSESEDKRRWFIAREIELFRLRWLYLTEAKRNEFLILNNLKYNKADEREKQTAVKLSYGFMTVSQEYYVIPVWKVADLVRSRKVFIHKGTAYITNDDIISVLLASYRSTLAQALAYVSRRLHILDDDPRILGLVKGAGKNTREADYTNFVNKDKVDIRQLDTLAEISYPLCMRQMHQRLRTAHHLKHFARLQYGLFLKGIGVSLEDALQFWRSEFCKQMDPEKFEKSYSYNIRHSYGREGKRSNYAPQSCMKIISSPASPGQYHGCPFKTFDSPALLKALQSNGFSMMAQHEIADLAKKGHYQLACSAYFSHSHKGAEQILVAHPNHYFDESQKILMSKLVKKEEKGSSSFVKPPAEKVKSDAPKTDVWEDMGIDLSDVPLWQSPRYLLH
uniref:DNA primase large subunit n=2 Tax=Lygus hesperus TaxID=30085 RepID=A0A0K8TFX0_LYGHE